jgi:hypothetical protein
MARFVESPGPGAHRTWRAWLRLLDNCKSARSLLNSSSSKRLAGQHHVRIGAR